MAKEEDKWSKKEGTDNQKTTQEKKEENNSGEKKEENNSGEKKEENNSGEKKEENNRVNNRKLGKETTCELKGVKNFEDEVQKRKKEYKKGQDVISGYYNKTSLSDWELTGDCSKIEEFFDKNIKDIQIELEEYRKDLRCALSRVERNGIKRKIELLEKEYVELEANKKAQQKIYLETYQKSLTVNIENPENLYAQEIYFALLVAVLPTVDYLELLSIHSYIIEGENIVSVTDEAKEREKASVLQDMPTEKMAVWKQKGLYSSLELESIGRWGERIGAHRSEIFKDGKKISVLCLEKNISESMLSRYSNIVYKKIFFYLQKIIEDSKLNLSQDTLQKVAYKIGFLVSYTSKNILNIINFKKYNFLELSGSFFIGYMDQRGENELKQLLKEVINTKNLDLCNLVFFACGKIGEKNVGVSLDIVEYLFERFPKILHEYKQILEKDIERILKEKQQENIENLLESEFFGEKEFVKQNILLVEKQKETKAIIEERKESFFQEKEDRFWSYVGYVIAVLLIKLDSNEQKKVLLAFNKWIYKGIRDGEQFCYNKNSFSYVALYLNVVSIILSHEKKINSSLFFREKTLKESKILLAKGFSDIINFLYYNIKKGSLEYFVRDLREFYKILYRDFFETWILLLIDQDTFPDSVKELNEHIKNLFDNPNDLTLKDRFESLLIPIIEFINEFSMPYKNKILRDFFGKWRNSRNTQKVYWTFIDNIKK